MKIIYLDESAVNLNNDIDYSVLQSLGEFITYPVTKSAEKVIEYAKGSDCILVTNKVQITPEIVRVLLKLKHIAVTATGYNNVDIATCQQAGVSVSNVPGYSTDSVAQHIFAFILNLATRIHTYDQDIRNGAWQKCETFTLLTYPTFELKGKTIGIIGFGTIGKEVAKLAEAFGMKVLVNRKSNKQEGSYPLCSLDELYAEADVISLNCPLTDENKGMINIAAFKKMKSSAILINTARGPLVDQADLAIALNTGQIAGAGIDVLDAEPPTNNPLLENVKNLILSPHSAWSTYEARQRLIDEVALNVQAFLKGEKRNWVGV